MARNIKTEREKPVATNCDICRGVKNRNGSKNRQVYQILSFEDLENLKGHLKSVFGTNHYCVDFFTQLWVTAHQIYGAHARDLQQPLWLVYLEAHGVTVKNRGDSIMKHRGQIEQQR